MSDQEELLNHEYDGIREYDNPIPGWWRLLFLLSIIWAAGYFLYYVVGDGLSESQVYDQEMAALQAVEDAAPKAEVAAVTESMLEGKLNDPAVVAAGKQKFDTVCMACHGTKGEGTVGPNLTDNHWVHGKGTLVDIHHVVSKGVIEKGMAAWEKTLKPDELNAVVAYVGSLRGKMVAGKKAEGLDVTAAAVGDSNEGEPNKEKLAEEGTK